MKVGKILPVECKFSFSEKTRDFVFWVPSIVNIEISTLKEM